MKAPLIYEKGTQRDVTAALESVLREEDVIFSGKSGSGKSVIALMLAKSVGKTIIAVPFKHLQDQYIRDYQTARQYILKPDGKPLRVVFMKGRGNFQCLYEKTTSCAAHWLPCVRPLNKERGETRWQAASTCPYWCPIYPEVFANHLFKGGMKRVEYMGVGGKWVIGIPEEQPCLYGEQALASLRADVTVMNTAKWRVETVMGRKMKVPLEVLDEYDLTLDGFAFGVNLHREVEKLPPNKKEAKTGKFEEERKRKEGLLTLHGKVLTGKDEVQSAAKDFVDRLYVVVEDLMTGTFKERVEDLYFKLRIIDEYWEESVVAERDMKKEAVCLALADPRPVLRRMKALSGRWLLMTATPHSQEVLNGFFQVEYPIIYGRRKQPGALKLPSWGKGCMGVTHTHWKSPVFQDEFFRVFRRMVDQGVTLGRTLVFPVGKKYILQGGVNMLSIPLDTADEESSESGGLFKEWLEGKFPALASFRTERGVDLKDDLCRSIIVAKYPLPDITESYYRSLKKRFPTAFWSIINDIATRRLIQMVGRGLRHDGDWVTFASPDAKAYNAVLNSGVFNIEWA